MKRNLTKFFNLIKNDKQAKTLMVIGLLMLFIFTIGYSLSMFTGSKGTTLANIKVNDLSFNMTTNSGTSDDRILHLQAGKTELFSVVINNLNNVDVSYELLYDVCSDSNCTNVISDLPENVSVGYVENDSDELNGIIEKDGSAKTITLLTTNKNSSDVYIRLNLNAGYGWNDLNLVNQFNKVNYGVDTQVIAYIDGVETGTYPDTCNYTAKITAYRKNTQVTLTDAAVTCNSSTNVWKTTYTGFVDRLVINFTSVPYPTISDYIADAYTSSASTNGMFKDDTDDKNIRYTGASPNNYLEFGNNGEIWRIIGVFNVYNNDTKQTEKLVKIVKTDAITNVPFDTSNSNNWVVSTLKDTLNSTAYNNISAKYQNLVADVTWNLGGYLSGGANAPTGKELYNYERGTAVYGTYPTTWNGKIALIYASDYVYASANTTCHGNGFTSACSGDNWLKDSNLWVLGHYRTNTNLAHGINWGSYISYINANTATYKARPTLYLNNSARVLTGTGTSSDPYKLSV